MTSPVYIICGGYSLTFGTKSESSRACSEVCETPTGTESKSAARGRIETPLKRSVVKIILLNKISVIGRKTYNIMLDPIRRRHAHP